jgi:hypothetical protein
VRERKVRRVAKRFSKHTADCVTGFLNQLRATGTSRSSSPRSNPFSAWLARIYRFSVEQIREHYASEIGRLGEFEYFRVQGRAQLKRGCVTVTYPLSRWQDRDCALGLADEIRVAGQSRQGTHSALITRNSRAASIGR